MSERSISLQRGDHVCHLYSDFDELKAFALQFIWEGLQNGEHCLYVIPHRELAAAGLLQLEALELCQQPLRLRIYDVAHVQGS